MSNTCRSLTMVAILALLVSCSSERIPSGPRPLQIAGAGADRFANEVWSEPIHLGPEVNSSSRELRAALSPDDLSLYITSDRPGGSGGLDLWVSHRDCTDCPWQAAVNLGSTINGEANEGTPAFSTDGHFLFFTSNRVGGSGGDDIYVAYRRDPHDDFAWEAPTNLGSDVNTPTLEFGSGFQQNAPGSYAELYFTRGDAVASAIYSVSLERRGNTITTVGPATAVDALNEPGFMSNSPTLRGDGKEIIFWSNRPGSSGPDLWVSNRETPHDTWSTPTNLGAPVNTAFADFEASISRDGRTLFFSANAARGGFGRQDIWVTTRAPGTP